MANPYYDDPHLYLFTSLSSGSSQIVTATSRLELILKANRVPFKAVDIATDDKARQLWGRRAGKDESGRLRKLPGLVQEGFVVGDLVEVEDWNEYGELKEHVKIVGEDNLLPARKVFGPVKTATPAASSEKENTKPEGSGTANLKASEEPKAVKTEPTGISLALRQVGVEAAQKAKDNKKAAVETFSGVGKAEPAKEKDKAEEKEKATPAPISTASTPDKHTIDSLSSLQSPNSTAWKTTPSSFAVGSMATALPPPSMDKLESLQSPNSTSWKPTDIDKPVLTHRGSLISEASEDEIREVEEEEAIPEEDEEDDEEDDDEEDDEEDEEEDEDEEKKKEEKK